MKSRLTQQQRKKAVERFYLKVFQGMKGWTQAVIEREEPDFLLEMSGEPGRAVGIEITQLYKDEGSGGSPQKRLEKMRSQYLQKVATLYYAEGGKPLHVQANLSLWDLDDAELPRVVTRLLEERPIAVPGKSACEVILGCYSRISKFYMQSLPNDAGAYSRWICVDNSVDWVRSLNAQVLTGKIEEKATKLPEYRKAADQTILLIVAEKTQGSGMFDYTPQAALLPSQGFSEVHLLIHPEKTFRIA